MKEHQLGSRQEFVGPRLSRRRPPPLHPSTQVITFTDPVSGHWQQPDRNRVALLRKQHWIPHSPLEPLATTRNLKVKVEIVAVLIFTLISMTFKYYWPYNRKLVPPFSSKNCILFIQSYYRVIITVPSPISYFLLLLLSFNLGYFAISFPVMQH